MFNRGKYFARRSVNPVDDLQENAHEKKKIQFCARHLQLPRTTWHRGNDSDGDGDWDGGCLGIVGICSPAAQGPRGSRVQAKCM